MVVVVEHNIDTAATSYVCSFACLFMFLQCDQIKLFLKGLHGQFSNKVVQMDVDFWATFGKSLGTFYSGIWSHCVSPSISLSLFFFDPIRGGQSRQHFQKPENSLVTFEARTRELHFVLGIGRATIAILFCVENIF